MTTPQTSKSSRSAATFIGVVAIVQMATVVWLLYSCSAPAAVTLVAEAVAVLVAALVIRADLRPPQRHQVK
ncbi:MAG TPA: hypothetical protein VF057_01480 [Thermoanaerobaculia bacterium]